MNIPKYRAWHKQLKRMYEVLSIDFEHKMISCPCQDGCETGEDGFDFAEIELMQFTTLSNGDQEIWQGDICRHKEDTENGRLHEQYEVYWSEDRWGLRHIERKEDYDNGSYYQAFQVVSPV